MKTLTLLFIVALVVALLVPGIDGKVSAGKKQKIKTAAKVAKVKATTKASTKVKAATATHVAAAPCDCTTPDVQAAIRVQCDPKQMEAIISGEFTCPRRYGVWGEEEDASVCVCVRVYVSVCV